MAWRGVAGEFGRQAPARPRTSASLTFTQLEQAGRFMTLIRHHCSGAGLFFPKSHAPHPELARQAGVSPPPQDRPG